MKSVLYFIIAGLLTIIGLSACSSNEDDTDAGKLRGITLQLGPSGTRDSRSYGGDINANEHEFIHSLHVFIVDNASGMVEWAAHEDFNGDTDAAAGNLIQKAYNNLTLAAGAKTIYAFANMDNVYFTDGTTATVDAQLEAMGTTTTAAELTAFSQKIVNDPAASIDFNNQSFIPMCVVETATLSTNSQTLTVEMARLVCRVDFTLRNSRDTDITVNSLTMQPLYGTVGLFEATSNTAETRAATKTVVTSASPVTIAPSASHLFSFYVNATEVSGSTPFTFSIGLEGETTTYTGTTAATSLPRNSILPVAANFSDYVMSLNVTAQIAPIGGYPVTVFTGSNLITYTLNLPEGCSFTIAPTMTYKDGTAVTMAQDGWKLSFNDASVDWLTFSPASTTTGGSFSGIVSAQTGLSTELTLASETAQGRTEDFAITVNTVSVSEFTLAASKQFNVWSATPEEFELVSLTKK